MGYNIYTIGYEKRNIEEYINELHNADIKVLVDVREYAWSYKKGFSKTQFSSKLSEANIQYVHLPQAGNPKIFRKNAKSVKDCLNKYKKYLHKTRSGIDELEALIKSAKADKQNICLTCFEREHSLCHRSIITDFLNNTNKLVKVFHL